MSPEDRKRSVRGDAPDPGNLKNIGNGKAFIDQLAEGALEQVSASIVRDSNGKYYWLHEVSLYRSVMFLFLVMKIFFFLWLALALFLIGLNAFDNGLGEALSSMGLPMLWVLLFLIALVTLSYYLYAWMMGGRYSVLFRMDEKGVSHTQLPRQYKRAQALGTIATLAGLLTGNYAAAGAGMLSASRSTMHTSFKKVSAIKPRPRQHTIKLRSGLMHNQLYTAPEDFDFVLGFIQEHAGKPVS